MPLHLHFFIVWDELKFESRQLDMEQTLSPKTIPLQPKSGNADVYPKLIVRRLELARLLGISRSMTYLKEKPTSPYFDPFFPKSIRIGKRAIGWIYSDVKHYLDSLVEQSLVA